MPVDPKAGQRELTPRMRRLADSGHASAPELREKADALDTAAAGFFGDPQTVDVKRFMGCWARATRLWSECSGEPLVPKAVTESVGNLMSALQTLGAGRNDR